MRPNDRVPVTVRFAPDRGFLRAFFFGGPCVKLIGTPTLCPRTRGNAWGGLFCLSSFSHPDQAPRGCLGLSHRGSWGAGGDGESQPAAIPPKGGILPPPRGGGLRRAPATRLRDWSPSDWPSTSETATPPPDPRWLSPRGFLHS